MSSGKEKSLEIRPPWNAHERKGPKKAPGGGPRTLRRREMSGTTDEAPRRVQDDVPAKAAHDTVQKAYVTFSRFQGRTGK